MRSISNREIAKVLFEIALYLEMDNVQFKPRAYEKAAHAVEGSGKEMSEIYRSGRLKALMEVPAVGKSIAEKIEELLKTGKCEAHQKLRKKMPVDIEELTAIEGVGPKKIKILYSKLKIRSIEDLERAIKAGKLRGVEGFGIKSEENILKGIEFQKRHRGRFILGEVADLIRTVEGRLRKLKEVERISIAGSARRWKETVGDLDFLVVSTKPSTVMDYFTSMPEVSRIMAKGKTKSMVQLQNGIDADLRVVAAGSYGAALQYFTGNINHNIALRKIAISKGWKLNEYGVFSGKKQIAGKSEEEVYKKLGLKWIPPEIRANLGEIEAARTERLPKLVEYGDLKGDLQTQTSWTDGANTIKEMAEAARAAGLEYIAITDHTKSLAMTGGLDEKKLLKQAKEIKKVNGQVSGITVLSGAEVNILKDGKLDIKDSVLRELDVVGAAVHSNFGLPEKEQTARILKAVSNVNVDILFHPTGRVINQREAYKLNIEKVIEAAVDSGTILEINAYPERLDLKDEHIRIALKLGAKFSIDSDAHSSGQFRFLEFGIAQARRGWAGKKDIVNARPLNKMLKMLR